MASPAPTEPGPGPAPTPTPAPLPAPAPAPPSPTPPTYVAPVQRTAADYERQLSDLNAEAAQHRIDARRQREAAEANAAEAARLRQENEALQQREREAQAARDQEAQQRARYQDQYITAEIKAAAVRERFIDPDLVDAIRQHPGIDIRLDDNGNLVGLPEAIAKVKAEKPHLFRAARSSTGSDSPAPPADPQPPPENVRTLSPADYEKRKQEERRRLTALRA